MSIRRRMLLIVIALNLGVLGLLQLASTLLLDRWRAEQREVYENFFAGILRDAYAPEQPSALASLRTLLSLDTFRGVFRDVLVTNGRGPGAPGFVDLDPMGSAHRDHATFPLQDVRLGIRRAMAERTLITVSDGYCVPISSGDQVVAGAWFKPYLPPPPQLPRWILVGSLAIGALAIVGLAHWSVQRSIVAPLRELSSAAARVGAGDYRVRVPTLPGDHEVNALVEGFNRMAERVAGHTEELDRAVRAATEAAERRERALVLSGRLAAMGTLAAGIAHEINNPIAGMLNAVRRLAERQDLSERDRRYLGLVQDGLARVGDIARRVLDFSPRQVDAVRFSVAEPIERARSLVEHRLRSGGIEFRCQLPPRPPLLRGDPHELQQVILNLLINAIDVLEGRPEPRVTVAVRVVGDSVEISVRDNGPGMPKAELARVFDPFYSGKGRPDASGLGLFISYSIVANHGGSIEVDSAPEAGFAVRISLPLAE